MGGRQAEFRDPQVAPKHLATAVSTAKRSQNEGEKGRQRGEASLSSNEVKAIVHGTRHAPQRSFWSCWGCLRSLVAVAC